MEDIIFEQLLFTLIFGTFASHLLNKEKSVLKRSSYIRDFVNENKIISDGWKWFMLRMLEDESCNRPTANEALDFSWLQL